MAGHPMPDGSDVLVSLLASNILKRPREVKQVAAQIWGYLAATMDEGLIFTAKDEEEGFQSFTDAFGEDCQGFPS